jgi:hypothetical protein
MKLLTHRIYVQITSTVSHTAHIWAPDSINRLIELNWKRIWNRLFVPLKSNCYRSPFFKLFIIHFWQHELLQFHLRLKFFKLSVSHLKIYIFKILKNNSQIVINERLERFFVTNLNLVALFQHTQKISH